MLMKRVYIIAVMCLVALMGLKPALQAQTVWDGTADISWYDGSQTSFDISTPEQLAGLAQLVNNGTSFSGVTLNLTNDIWLNADNDSTNNWTPIGGGSPSTAESPSTGNAFKGNFNGHGHSIYNLYCDKGSTFHAGLFCALENPCTIDSLVMVNPVLKSRGMMGCITGFPRGSNSVYIRHCLVINARIEGENSSGSNNIGGIMGAGYPNSGSTYIQNCGVTGSITGHYPGGIAGNAERTYITNAYFAGTLYAYSTNYGGMTAHAGNRTNCYSYAQVLSSTSQSSASNDGTPVTQAEMQSANMITLLGDAFTMDIGINNGYPIMSYMAGITPAAAEICAGESVTLTANGLDNYLWNTGATTESITVFPTTTTTYTVSGSYQGISATLSSVITVYPQAVISATVMAGSDGQVHGTVTPETSMVACGSADNITITVTPDAGYRIEQVTLNGVEVYGDEFGPGEQTLTINPGGTLGEVKIYLSKCAIVTLPFTDDLETYTSSQVPECYTKISTNSYPYAYNSTSYSHSGSKCIYAYMYNTTDNYMLVLPKMYDMNTYPMESLMVNFWARTSNINNSVTVGVMSDPTDASTFTPLQTFTFAATGVYDQYTAYFGSEAAGKPYIAFKYNCGSTYTYIYMDDITVDVAPTCSPVTNLTVDNVYGTNASLAWNANTVGETLEYLITVTDNDANVMTYTTTETQYLLSGLSELTSYTVSVQPDCGGGDFGEAVTVSFMTPCNSPVDVIVGNGTSTNSYFPTHIYYGNSYTQQIVTASYFEGSSADFSSLSFKDNTTSTTTRQCDVYLAHVPDSMTLVNGWILPDSTNGIVFTQVYSGGVQFGTGDWITVNFESAFSYNGYDNLLVVFNDHTNSYTSTHNFVVHSDATTTNMSRYNYRDNTVYDAFNPGVAGTVTNNVNNFKFGYCDQSTCLRPNTVAVGATDAYSAELSWVNPNTTENAEIEYKADGYEDWTSTGSFNGSSYTLYGLEANTVYQVRLRALCGGSDMSLWTDPVTFRTECEAIWELPYTQNFDGDDHYGSGEDAYIYCWDRYTNNPSSPVYYSTSSSAHSLSGMLRFDDGSSVTNIAIMPKVDESISVSELQVSFWVKNTSASSTAVLELGVMTDKTDPTTFETLDTIHPQVVNQYNLIEYSLANYTGYGQYIAFRASNGNGGNNLRLDDVTLDYIPVCQHPFDLVVDMVASDGATFHWTEVGDASAWYVEYGPAGFTPGEGTTENAYDTYYTIYGLNPNTQYDVYVWSDCSGSESTSIDATFRTDCGPVASLPYNEDFETGLYNTGMYNDGTANQQRYILCWDRLASDNAHHVYIANSTNNSHSGAYFMDFHWTPNCYNIAIAPELDQSFDVSQLMVNFWACKSGSAGMLEVGVMTDKTADSTFVPVDTIDLSAMANYAYAEQFVKFSSYTGDGKYIAFRVSNAPSSGYYIDDLTIDYAPACSPVNDLAVSDITGTTAQVTWTPGHFGTVDDYTLEYSEAGMENWTTVNSITEATYLLSGLDFSTDYDLRVKPNCDDLSSGDWVITSFRTQCLTGGDFTIGDGTATNSYLPSYSTYNYSYTQQLFLASEIGSPRSIESVTFEKVAGNVNRTLKIYLMHTSATSGGEWIDATSAQLVFDTAQTLQNGLNTFNFSTPFEYNGTDNLLLVVVDMTGSWSSGNTWRTHTAPFTASRYIYQDGSAYSTASIPSGGTGTSSRNNVIFGAACGASTCAAPVVSVSNITSDGATVNWVPGYMESAWEMEYRPLSDTNWVSMGTVTSMSEVITGLNPNTAYKVRMRSVCDGGEYSFWTEANFTTACGAYTVTQDNPWTEDFENNTTMACFDTPVTYTNSNGSTYPKMLLNYSLAAHSGGNSLEFKGDTNMLLLPEFTNDIHDLRMSFWATTWGVTTTAVVGVLSDMNDPASFEALGDAGTPGPRGPNGSTGNGNFMGPFDFNTVQATSGRIAILFTGTTASDAGWNLDDFTVELIPSCAAPAHTSVAVSNVTANSADISFADDDPSHSTWVIYYGPTGTSTDTWSSVNVNSTFYTLTGLNSNTHYSAYVMTLCGGVEGDDQTNTVTFNTTTVPATLPYTTDFEDATDNLEWGILNGTQTNKWYIGAPTDGVSDVNTTISGTNGLYISNDGGVSNTYQGSESRVYAYRDILVPDGTTELILSFDWKAQGGLYNYEFLRVYWLDPSEVTLSAGNNPPTVNGVNYDAAGQPGNFGPNASEHWLSVQNTWQHKEMVISADQFVGMGTGDKTYRLVFHWRNTSYNSQPPAAVDNIELRAITCATPTGLYVSNVGENDATLSWIGNADSYGVTITSAMGTDYQTTTTNSLTLTGLNPSTSYQVTVKAFCSGDSSMVSQPVSFTTACGAISVATAPWTTDFEGTDAELLNCWISATTGYYSGNTFPHITTASSIAHSGTRALEIAFGDIVTALPLFVEDLSNLQVSFWTKTNNYSSDNPTMELGYMTDPFDVTTFVVLETLSGSTYTQTTRTFADLAGLSLPNTTRIAFRYTRPTGSSLSSWYVDDIEVSLAGPGPVITNPTVTTTAASNVQQNSATLNGVITNPDNVTITSKGFEWKATAGGAYTPVVVTGSALTHNLTGLNPNTNYTYKAFITYNGQTVYGNEMTFTTLPGDTPEPCDAPTGLTVSAVTDESITVVWDDNANVNSWNIQYSAVGGTLNSATSNTNSYTISGLQPETAYSIQVQANCGNGNVSSWSPAVTGTTTTGINSWLENSVSLYPNPAKEVVNVQCTMNNVQIETVEVFDVYGKLVNTFIVTENPTRINISGLADGMYFVRVVTEEGMVTKTFIKK